MQSIHKNFLTSNN
uniref:Uncharacterized protein n=1 Tax=Rhizophora mucronata TaxID=61149 RepID=A0A2P2QM61_RHIMU